MTEVLKCPIPEGVFEIRNVPLETSDGMVTIVYAGRPQRILSSTNPQKCFIRRMATLMLEEHVTNPQIIYSNPRESMGRCNGCSPRKNIFTKLRVENEK